VDESDAQRGGDMSEMTGGEGGAVIDIQFSRQAPLGERPAQGVAVGIEVLPKIKLGMGNQAAHVVDEGEEVGFAKPALGGDLDGVHAVRLPEIVGQFRLELAPVHRCRLFLKPLPLEKSIKGCLRDPEVGRHQAPPLGLPKHRRQCHPPVFLLEPDQGQGLFFIQRPGRVLVGPVIRIKALQPPAALFPAPEPVEEGGTADPGPGGKWDLPVGLALVLQNFLFFAPAESAPADEVRDDPEPEPGDVLFDVFVHGDDLLRPSYPRTPLLSPQKSGGESLNNAAFHAERLASRELVPGLATPAPRAIRARPRCGTGSTGS